jgi:hypothetical protein
MAKTNEEVIELLEGKIEDLTKLLEETLAEGKGIAKKTKVVGGVGWNYGGCKSQSVCTLPRV